MGKLLQIVTALLCLPIICYADDLPNDAPANTSQLVFKGYDQAAAFSIAKESRRRIRCARCHDKMDPNFTPRELDDAPHTDSLSHGKGKLWCLTCHNPLNRNKLRTMVGETVEFDQAYLVCGACHSNRQKDWYFGAHGKRKANWQGDRVIYNCTHCHDPHEPNIKPREAQAAPPVRKGLERPKQQSHDQLVGWRLFITDKSEVSDGH